MAVVGGFMGDVVPDEGGSGIGDRSGVAEDDFGAHLGRKASKKAMKTVLVRHGGREE